jgi:cell wall-associated NlpC family hydrolase
VSASRVLDTADDYLGTPYRYGGTSPSQGFDCSGFVRYVYARNGVRLPRTSRQMAAAGAGLLPALAVLRPGDLVLFAQDGSRIDHVAIYAGASRIIHSSSSGSGVRYDDFETPRGRWFLDHMVAARRVIADGRSLVADLVGALAADTLDLDPPDRAPRPR